MDAARPILPMTGGCSCGMIRYRIISFPLLLYTCNCTNCQAASGSAFALNMPVWRKDFHILQGEPKGWHHTSPMGVAVVSWFCGECGGRLYGARTVQIAGAAGAGGADPAWSMKRSFRSPHYTTSWRELATVR